MDRQSRRTHAHNVPAARELRTHQTEAEEALWAALRGRRLDGLKFRRQHPVGPFVIDFCCAECRLAVEIDGAVHAAQQDRDAEREALLAAAGYRVLRFPNDAVQHRLPDVLATILAVAREEPTPRPPAPGRKAGWS
jgi:very-short-patch-repair endonuclease